MYQNIKKEINYPVVIAILIAVIVIQSVVIYQGCFITKLKETKQRTLLQVEMAKRNEQLERIQKDLDDSMYQRNEQLRQILKTVKEEMNKRNEQLEHIQSGVHHLNGLFGIKCDKTNKVASVDIYPPKVTYHDKE